MHSRRRLMALAGAGALALLPGAEALAAMFVRGRNSRLPAGPGDGVYVPPSTHAALVQLASRMTVGVRLNGEGPFSFVVDTGANQSVISAELAERLSLPLQELAPLHGVAGMQLAHTTVVDTMQVGRRVSAGVAFAVLPEAAVGANGLLGIEHFRDLSLTLDFEGRRLRVGPSRSPVSQSGSVTLRAVQKDGRLSIVDALVAGRPVAAFLDSGAQRTIGNAPLRAMAEPLAPTHPLARTPILSATGQEIPSETAVLPSLQVGALTLHRLQCAFAPLHIFRLWDLDRQPAILLGMDVLSQFASVTLDLARSEVSFRMPGSS